jgi:phospholipid transport system transporter-binding protein
MGNKNKGGAVKGEVQVAMPADFRIAEVAEMHRQLREALDGSGIVLDGGAVDRVDTAALQLLVVFQHEAQKRNHPVTWAAVSAPLHDAASQLALAQTLALPAKQPA